MEYIIPNINIYKIEISKFGKAIIFNEETFLNVKSALISGATLICQYVKRNTEHEKHYVKEFNLNEITFIAYEYQPNSFVFEEFDVKVKLVFKSKKEFLKYKLKN